MFKDPLGHALKRYLAEGDRTNPVRIQEQPRPMR